MEDQGNHGVANAQKGRGRGGDVGQLINEQDKITDQKDREKTGIPEKLVLDIGSIKGNQAFPSGFPGLYKNLPVCNNQDNIPNSPDGKHEEGEKQKNQRVIHNKCSFSINDTFSGQRDMSAGKDVLATILPQIAADFYKKDRISFFGKM